MARIVDGKESFRAAQIVTSAGIALQELIQRRFAAVEGFTIMRLPDRLLVPGRDAHDLCGNARAAARSFAFGLAGVSRRCRTRWLSLFESWICSASSMTVFATRRAS